MKTAQAFNGQKIRDAARRYPCQNPLCGADDGTIVAAHSNSQRHGKGTGHKAHDIFVAFVCHRCHDQIDGRAGGLAREERDELWRLAHDRTLLALCRDGVIKT